MTKLNLDIQNAPIKVPKALSLWDLDIGDYFVLHENLARPLVVKHKSTKRGHVVFENLDIVNFDSYQITDEDAKQLMVTRFDDVTITLKNPVQFSNS